MCLSTGSVLINAFQLKTFVYKYGYRITDIKEPPLANSRIREMLERTLDFFSCTDTLFYPASFQVKNFTPWL